jgi:PPK2 family polyphosphate:nucleotide phosphotransferase
LCPEVTIHGETGVKIDQKQFQARPGKKCRLGRWPTKIDALYHSKEHAEQLLARQIDELREQQSLLYASDRHALLVIFQAMDAAGKDGAIKHVMSGVNPQGCQVYSFKHPSATELEHDFLWRTTQCLPERGQIGIFNRSYYEEVLIARVHPEILAAQDLPGETLKHQKFWRHRYQSINDLEQHLLRNGTHIIKFFLHISKKEQLQRFIARIDNPEKNWKFSDADVDERQYWDDYMQAYEACISATSTEEAPWYVVPADDKANARLIIADTIVETLKKLKMRYPATSKARRAQLLAIRERLLTEG